LLCKAYYIDFATFFLLAQIMNFLSILFLIYMLPIWKVITHDWCLNKFLFSKIYHSLFLLSPLLSPLLRSRPFSPRSASWSCFKDLTVHRKQFFLCFFFCRSYFLLYIAHALFYPFCFLSNILFCFVGSASYSSLHLRLCKVLFMLVLC